MNIPIPDELKGFLALDGVEDRLAVVQSLVRSDRKGEIITVTSLASEELTKFFDGYYAHPNHAADPAGKLRRDPSLADKITALRAVLPKLDPNPDNYEPHLTFLDTLRLLRNKAGHESGISPEDATTLAQNPEVLAIIADFPEALWKKLRALVKYLNGLPL